MRRRKRNYQSHAPPPREGQETFPYTEFSYKLSFNRPFKAESFFDRVGINPRGTPKIQRQTSRRRGTSRENSCTSQKTTTIKPHSAAAGRSGDLPLHGIQQQTAVQQGFPRKSAVSYTNPSTQIRKLLPPKIDDFFKSTSPIFAKYLLHPKMTKKSLHSST